MAVDVSQVRHLAFDLHKAPAEVQARGALAVKKTLFDIEGDAQVFVDKDTGNLGNSISTDVDEDGLGGEVGPTAEYGDDVEYGTSPHLITPKNGQFLRFQIGGRTVFARVVHHPGTAPRPYMGPAADRNIPRLEQALGQAGQDIL